MATEPQKAQVTELHVRMDCNGCVQRIKKAMHSINGVYEVYIDLPQQKLTVVGIADPQKLVKAIKKARKTATIFSHTEQVKPSGSDPPTAEPPASSSDPPAADAASQPPSEAPPAEATPPTEPPKETPPPDNPPPEAKAAPEAQDPSPNNPKDVEVVHMMHHYPHNYAHGEHWNNNYSHMGHDMRHETPYSIATHSYNTYRPSPYVTEYGYLRSPPQDMRYNEVEAGYGYHQSPPQDVRYNGEEAYSSDGYYQNRGGGGNQISSMFSDEDPNACRIM